MRALLLLAVFFVSCGAPMPEERPEASFDAGTSSSSSTPDAGRSALEQCRDLCPFARDVEIGPRGDCVCIL